MEDINYMPKVQFIKSHPDAILPSKNHASDTGFDVYAVEDITIPAKGSGVVPVGIKVGFIPEGYWFKVEGRSGLGFKHSLLPHPGIIDNEYRGDCGVKIYNFSDVDYNFKKGDRCAQFVFYLNLSLELEWGNTPQASNRGDKGFGSSGK
jgi:dUTP pyrophosphatase|tara:strand:+ start:16020 stop:16466 length:447 start_codon:yes stop_codon:yes gene_type:complete